MGKYLIDAALAIILFLFLYRIALRYFLPKQPDPTNAEQLRSTRETLIRKQSKLRNKTEIAKLEVEITKLNAALAELP